jgi:hypothetical protein
MIAALFVWTSVRTFADQVPFPSSVSFIPRTATFRCYQSPCRSNFA